MQARESHEDRIPSNLYVLIGFLGSCSFLSTKLQLECREGCYRCSWEDIKLKEGKIVDVDLTNRKLSPYCRSFLDPDPHQFTYYLVTLVMGDLIQHCIV